MLKKLSTYLLLFSILGCSSGGSNSNKDGINSPESTHLSKQKIDSAIAKSRIDSTPTIKTDSSVTDPDTVFSEHAMNVISDFPEMKVASAYIDSASNHKKVFVIILQGYPSIDGPYYYINAGEQSATNEPDDHFVPYMHFDVYKQSHRQMLIKYHTTVDDREISIREWRKKEDSLRKEGKKDWFFVY